jgi:hypothetical protein
MVLLSVAGRLPSSPTTSNQSYESPSNLSSSPLQIFCATTSFSHPSVPIKSGFNRMELGISGFLLEEDGEGGSKIVQVTDLSGLGCRLLSFPSHFLTPAPALSRLFSTASFPVTVY